MNSRLKEKYRKKLYEDLHTCPECGSTDLTASDYNSPEAKMLTCKVKCDECGLEWTEGYQFKFLTINE